MVSRLNYLKACSVLIELEPGVPATPEPGTAMVTQRLCRPWPGGEVTVVTDKGYVGIEVRLGG